MEHAVIHQPSSLFRTVRCTGWQQLCGDIEQPDTPESMEGSAAHSVCEAVLFNRDRCENYIDRPAPNGVIITEEMTDAAQWYVGDILRTCSDLKMYSSLHIEHRVDIPQIHPMCFGTPDAFAWHNVTQTLYLWDFKYGHLSVDAEGNEQMAAYVAGIVNLLGVTPNTIVIRIVQPRCYDGQGAIREWVTDWQSVSNIIRGLASACAVADGIGAELTPGPKQCRDCPGRIRCKAFKAAGADVIQHVSQPVNVDEPDDVYLAMELNALEDAEKLLKARKDAVAEEIKHRIKQGRKVPNYGLETAIGRAKWKDDKQAIEVCDLLGVDIRKPNAVITPNQAEALLKKNSIDASVISDYHERPVTGISLVRDTSKRARLLFKESMKHG